MTLDEALEYAAEHLPAGCEISIYVEKGAASVTVSDWDGNWRDDYDSADMTIPEQVLDCVKWANEQPQQPNAQGERSRQRSARPRGYAYCVT